MSEYIVSARKYRPTTFHSVVGQRTLVQTLKNAIAAGKLAHAYLFCGPRGVGKTTCARIFAKTINCAHRTPEGEACNECESCVAFNEQRSLNVHELDAASNNGVDSIRELIDQVRIPPQVGRYKVFIIDEVHMLSTGAFNAFLKTLEEPPAHAIFILATTEKQKILPTILSRCQTYDFQRITVEDIATQLAYIAGQEGIRCEPRALQVIARKADGGMRDALSLFDQIVSFTEGNVTYQAVVQNLNILDYETYFRLTEAALGQNVPAALVILDDVLRRGFDAQYFIDGLAAHLRDLMMSKDAATQSLLEAGAELAQHYATTAARCPIPFLYAALQIAAECSFNYRNSRNKRLSVELALIRICQLLAPPPAAPAAPQGPSQTAPRAAAPQQAASAQAAPAQSSAPAAPRQAPAQRPASAGAPTATRPAPAAQPAQPAPAQSAPAAPAPQQAPASRFAPRNATGGAVAGTRTASIHGTKPSAAPDPAATQQDLPEMDQPVTPEALRRAWREYTSTIPTEKIVVTTMLECLPEQVEGTQYRVTLYSNEQMQRVKAHMAPILAFLAQRLQNTHIGLDLVEAAPGQKGPRAYTAREKLDEMRRSNPEGTAALIGLFNLELA